MIWDGRDSACTVKKMNQTKNFPKKTAHRDVHTFSYWWTVYLGRPQSKHDHVKLSLSLTFVKMNLMKNVLSIGQKMQFQLETVKAATCTNPVNVLSVVNKKSMLALVTFVVNSLIHVESLLFFRLHLFFQSDNVYRFGMWLSCARSKVEFVH